MKSSILKSIYFLGDVGCLNTNLNCLVSNIYRDFKNHDKIVLLGDNFYPNGLHSIIDEKWLLYRQIFTKIGFKNIWGILGNHDYQGNPKLQIISPYIKMPNFYYKDSLSPNTDLFYIDTVQLYENHCNIGIEDMERVHMKNYDQLQYNQLTWLKNELSKSKAINKIVIGHYPILTNGFYINSMDPLKNILFPIFIEYKVNAYISGHEHNIQYIKEKANEHTFHQFIVGSSSETRPCQDYVKSKDSLYDVSDNYYLKLTEYDSQELEFTFCNRYGYEFYKYRI